MLVNGPPAVGKSTLARRYLDEHPLALVVDIDGLRVAMGGWRENEDSKLLARDLAVALAETHLRSGHDVVIPQYLGRTEFIESLADVARRAGAEFVEVVVLESEAVCVERFAARRRELEQTAGDHPQGDVVDAAAVVTGAIAQLHDVIRARPQTRVISSGEDPWPL